MGHHQAARPGQWISHYLDVILDVFSRYVVGCMIAYREAAVLAERLLAEASTTQHARSGS